MTLFLPRMIEGFNETELTSVLPVLSSTAKLRTVLVVDAEADIRRGCSEVLRDAGFNVIEACDGASGLDILNSDATIDVVVSDIGMPGMNGEEMVDRAQLKRPNLPAGAVHDGIRREIRIRRWKRGGGLAALLSKPFAFGATSGCRCPACA